jgi:uncharacterized integral membrane protein (TIGR02327 family)
MHLISSMLDLLKISISIFSIYACWWALQSLKFERWVREPGNRQAKLLHLILAVILGHAFSQFIFSYMEWTFS